MQGEFFGSGTAPTVSEGRAVIGK